MNRKYKQRLVRAMYKVNDFPAFDEYGARIFGRPVRGTWRIFRHIARMATVNASNAWGWSSDRERVSYPGIENIPTFEEFATFLLHEVTHGWCYFLKDDPMLKKYPTDVDEEQVCWDVSRLVCDMLGIPYQKNLADLSHQFHCLHLTRSDDTDGLKRLIDKMPAHLRP